MIHENIASPSGPTLLGRVDSSPNLRRDEGSNSDVEVRGHHRGQGDDGEDRVDGPFSKKLDVEE